jgi:hypothetical protein
VTNRNKRNGPLPGKWSQPAQLLARIELGEPKIAQDGGGVNAKFSADGVKLFWAYPKKISKTKYSTDKSEFTQSI